MKIHNNYLNKLDILDKVIFNLEEFCNFFNLPKRTWSRKINSKFGIITKIEKEARIIVSSNFSVKEKNNENFEIINLFKSIKYVNTKLILNFNENFIEKYYLNQKTNYLSMYVLYIFKLTSTKTNKYSLRMYEYLRSFIYDNKNSYKYKNNKNKKIEGLSLEDFAKIIGLNLNSCYFKQTNQLKIRVLEPIKKDINNFTDILIDYQFKSSYGSKKYTGISFDVKLNKHETKKQNNEILNIKNKSLKIMNSEEIINNEEINYQIKDNYIYTDLPNNVFNLDFKNYNDKYDCKDQIFQSIQFLNKNWNKIKHRGLYIYGESGIGETYLSIHIANEFSKLKKSFVFASMTDLIENIK